MTREKKIDLAKKVWTLKVEWGVTFSSLAQKIGVRRQCVRNFAHGYLLDLKPDKLDQLEKVVAKYTLEGLH